MGIKKKSLVDIQCDSCDRKQTLEGEDYLAQLDNGGWRKISMRIERYVEPSGRATRPGLEERLLCGECLRNLKSLVKVWEEAEEAQLEELRKEAARKGQAG